MEEGKGTVEKIPVIDISACTGCESCIELCPSVFMKNEGTGLIAVADLPEYPEEDVREAMVCCPGDCIRWEDRRPGPGR